MKKLKAFVIGMVEFRSDFTMYYTSYELKMAYDRGREFAHKITLRKFEQ
jgi:hypothetical protein